MATRIAVIVDYAALPTERVDHAPALGDVLCKRERRLSTLLNAHSLASSLIKRTISFGLNNALVRSPLASACGMSAALWLMRHNLRFLRVQQMPLVGAFFLWGFCELPHHPRMTSVFKLPRAPRPDALLRLIANSNLTGAWIKNEVGL